MYRILVVDDKDEIYNSLNNVSEEDVSFKIMAVKNGRSAIELADEFSPDIVFIELALSGISSIDVMHEIKNNHPNVIFVIVSSCIKNEYIQDIINIGVFEYVSKPIQQKIMDKVVKNVLLKVIDEKKKRNFELDMKEKMKIITPIIEKGFIDALIYRKSEKSEIDHFCNLLNIDEREGYIMSLQFDNISELYSEKMLNDIAISEKRQKEYSKMKDIIKQYFYCYVGPVIGNKITIFLPNNLSTTESEYDQRIQIIEIAKKMVRVLRNNFDAKIKLGIGAVHSIYDMIGSHREAIQALENNMSEMVSHIKDLPQMIIFEETFLSDIENKMIKSIRIGNIIDAMCYAKNFFEWMVNFYKEKDLDIKLKVLEVVFCAEKICYEESGMQYGFIGRSKYLHNLMEMQDYYQLQKWFEERIIYVCRNIQLKKNEKNSDIVKNAMEYLEVNYAKDIDLEEVSKYFQISPYYFSKIFKKKTGKNFIEYLTQIRIEHAKILLSKSSLSMKEICMEVGYSDANYFSRVFKKNVGVCPTVYKDEIFGAQK